MLKKTIKNMLSSYSLFIIIYSIILTTFLVFLYVQKGVIYDDTLSYLNNALMFSGIELTAKYSLSPLIPYLTSVGFKLIHIGDGILYVICGIVFIFGIYGMFLLLKTRFSELVSTLGTLMFTSFTIIFPWAVIGIDIASISFSIWAIYLTIYAFKNNNNAFYLIFPFISLAVLTRYNAIFTIVPIIFLFIINYSKLMNEKKVFKKIFLGFIIGILISIPFFYHFYLLFGNVIPFFETVKITTTSTSMGTQDPVDVPNKLYYLKNLFNYISSNPKDYFEAMHPHLAEPNLISYILVFLSVMGLLNYIKIIMGKLGKLKNNADNYSIRIIKLILLSLSLILFILSLFSYVYLFSLFLGFLLCLSIYFVFKNSDIEYLDIDITMLLYFLVFFLYHSFVGFKVDRYFITAVPGLMYILILGINYFFKMVSPYFKQDETEVRNVLLSVLTIILLISSFSIYAENLNYPSQKNIENAAIWLKKYDSSLSDKIVASNYKEGFIWYLKKDVISGYYNSKNFKEMSSKDLVSKNVTYYIRYNSSFRNSLYYDKYNKTFELEDYKVIRDKNEIVIYKIKEE